MRKSMRMFSLLVMVGVIAASCLSTPAQAKMGVQLRTRLSGAQFNGSSPRGGAEYRSSNGRSTFRLGIEEVNLNDGTQLSVNLNGTAFATLTLNNRHGAVSLDTSNGDTIPVMMDNDVISVTDANGDLLASGTLLSKHIRVRLSTRLSGHTIGGVRPRGKASFAQNDDRLQFKLSADHVNLIDGTQLSVNLNGTAFATLTLNGGKAKLSLDTTNGDTVPTMQVGDIITVTDGNGNIILSGTF